MKQMTVNATDSKGLQIEIDKNGNNPAEFILKNNLLINSLVRFYNFADLNGCGKTLTLMQDAPVSPFGEQVPMIGSKLGTGINGLKIHDIIFEGNRDRQSKVPTNISHAGSNKNWGIGYHNFIGIGNLKTPVIANALNCEFYNLEFNNNLGDGIRVEGGTNIIVHDIKGKRGGHDIINLSSVLGGEVYNLDVDMAVNAAVRTRSSRNIKIHDCKINGNTGLAYSPGIQIQSTEANKRSSGIEIYNNYIYGTYGPGIQIAGSVQNNGLVTVRNNLIVSCGRMPASNKIGGVGGIVFDGFDVDIQNNTICGSLGYGIKAGPYDVVSTYKNKATIKNNIITHTKKSLAPGLMSGCGVADLTGGRCTSASNCNCLYGNVANYYNVTSSGDIKLDPLYTSTNDYHLQSQGGRYTSEGTIYDSITSPCVLSDHELGRYGGTSEASVFLSSELPAELPAIVIPRKDETDLRNFYNALLKSGLLKEDEKVEFVHVSNNFNV